MLGILQNYYGIEVIAEAGCNHGGDLSRALAMVRTAKQSGADTIKFQSFIPDMLVNAEDVYEWCKKSCLSEEDHAAIIKECMKEDINPLFSAFDVNSLGMLKRLEVQRVKIPSGQIFNMDILKLVAIYDLYAILSTGMCSFAQVRRAVNTLASYGLDKSKVTILQCTTAYPAPHEDANLLVMEKYRQEFGTAVGYSDHTLGWSASVAAAALGAEVIEKHFIMDSHESTPDACVSLDPDEFRAMTNHIHEARAARGSNTKRPRMCERKMFKRRDYGVKE